MSILYLYYELTLARDDRQTVTLLRLLLNQFSSYRRQQEGYRRSANEALEQF